MFSVQKKKSSFRGAEFPWKRRRRSFPFSLVKERVDLPCQVKDFVLDRHFSACERLDRTEAWGWDPGNMHSVICCLFPVPPNSFHASVLPTMLIVEVCYRTKQHGWTEAMSLDWKDVKMVCAMGRVPWRSHVASLISATVSRIWPPDRLFIQLGWLCFVSLLSLSLLPILAPYLLFTTVYGGQSFEKQIDFWHQCHQWMCRKLE